MFLGTAGPMSGQDLKAQSGLDTESLKATVYQLIEQGIVTKDNNTFDVTLEYRADGRDELRVREEADEFDDPPHPRNPHPRSLLASKDGGETAPATPPAKSCSRTQTRTRETREAGSRTRRAREPDSLLRQGFRPVDPSRTRSTARNSG
jgi:hypothetical protein